MSFFGALLASGIGILVSLRAPTARQAQQALSIANMILLFVPVFGFQALPAEVKAQAASRLAALSPGSIVLLILAALAVLGALLLFIAAARFRRDRSILDE